MKKKTPGLYYQGQDTAQILACKDTHRIDSLLCALERAIQFRQDRIPEVATTPEEHTLLAIMALQREGGRNCPGRVKSVKSKVKVF